MVCPANENSCLLAWRSPLGAPAMICKFNQSTLVTTDYHASHTTSALTLRRQPQVHLIAPVNFQKDAIRQHMTSDLSDSEEPLSAWHAVYVRAKWASPSDVKATFRSVSFVGKNVVLISHRNKYRLVENISYSRQAIFVKFVGTHKHYDQIEVGAL